MLRKAASMMPCRGPGGSALHPLPSNYWDEGKGAAMALATAEGEVMVVHMKEGAVSVGEPTTVCDDPISTMAVNAAGDKCVLAHGKALHVHDYPSVEDSSVLLCESMLDFTHVAFVKNDSLVLMAKQEPGIAYCDISSDNLEIQTIPTSGGGVRTFAVNNDLLAYLDDDGNVYILKLEFSGSQIHFNQLKRLGQVTSKAVVRSYDQFGVKMSWHPTENKLAIPSIDGSILIASAKSDACNVWEEEYLTSDEKSGMSHGNQDVCWVDFDKDGRSLATVDISGKILVWDMVQKTPLVQYEVGSPAFGIHWLQNERSIAVISADSVGCIADVTDVVNPSAVDGENHVVMATEDSPSTPAVAKAGTRKPSGSSGLRRLQKQSEDSEASDDDNQIFTDSLGEIRQSIMGPESTVIHDDEDGVHGHDHDHDDGDDDDYEAGDPLAGSSKMNGLLSGAASNGAPLIADPAASMQAAFQPAATPEDHKRRYMCWNANGVILSLKGDTFTSYEIDFTDTSMGRQQRFQDATQFTIAAMSDTGAVFASPGEYEDTPTLLGVLEKQQVRASTLFYRHLSSNGQWRVSLPKGEEAMAVAVGTGWAAVATSNNFLRVFSSTGLQDAVIWLDGTVVSMSGHQDRLFVVYHGGLPVDGVQTLDFKYFRIDGGIRHCQAEGRIPMSTVDGCVLQWLGFTDRNMPVMMDSMGMVSILAQQPGGWQWVPILDTGALKKSEQDHYWPVACRGDRLLAVKLKGEDVFPETHPRPVTTALDLRIPFVMHNKDNELLKQEHGLAWMKLICQQLDHDTQHGCIDNENLDAVDAMIRAQHAEMDKVLLRLLQKAMAADAADRAIELCTRLNLDASFTIALKIIDHYGMPTIAERVSKIQRMKQEVHLATQMQQVQANSHLYSSPQQSGGLGNLEQRIEDDDEEVGRSIAPTAGLLSRKASIRSEESVRWAEDKTPDQVPANPFCKTTPMSPTRKRKSYVDSLENFGDSPSPKPKLLRNTSFAKEARTKKRQDKILL